MLQLGTSWEPKRAAHDTSRSARAAKAVATSPATKKVLDASRQKLADSLSTQPKLEPMKPINEETTILVPHDQLKKNR